MGGPEQKQPGGKIAPHIEEQDARLRKVLAEVPATTPATHSLTRQVRDSEEGISGLLALANQIDGMFGRSPGGEMQDLQKQVARLRMQLNAIGGEQVAGVNQRYQAQVERIGGGLEKAENLLRAGAIAEAKDAFGSARSDLKRLSETRWATRSLFAAGAPQELVAAPDRALELFQTADNERQAENKERARLLRTAVGVFLKNKGGLLSDEGRASMASLLDFTRAVSDTTKKINLAVAGQAINDFSEGLSRLQGQTGADRGAMQEPEKTGAAMRAETEPAPPLAQAKAPVPKKIQAGPKAAPAEPVGQAGVEAERPARAELPRGGQLSSTPQEREQFQSAMRDALEKAENLKGSGKAENYNAAWFGEQAIKALNRAMEKSKGGISDEALRAYNAAMMAINLGLGNAMSRLAPADQVQVADIICLRSVPGEAARKKLMARIEITLAQGDIEDNRGALGPDAVTSISRAAKETQRRLEKGDLDGAGRLISMGRNYTYLCLAAGGKNWAGRSLMNAALDAEMAGNNGSAQFQQGLDEFGRQGRITNLISQQAEQNRIDIRMAGGVRPVAECLELAGESFERALKAAQDGDFKGAKDAYSQAIRQRAVAMAMHSWVSTSDATDALSSVGLGALHAMADRMKKEAQSPKVFQDLSERYRAAEEDRFGVARFNNYLELNARLFELVAGRMPTTEAAMNEKSRIVARINDGIALVNSTVFGIAPMGASVTDKEKRDVVDSQDAILRLVALNSSGWIYETDLNKAKKIQTGMGHAVGDYKVGSDIFTYAGGMLLFPLNPLLGTAVFGMTSADNLMEKYRQTGRLAGSDFIWGGISILPGVGWAFRGVQAVRVGVGVVMMGATGYGMYDTFGAYQAAIKETDPDKKHDLWANAIASTVYLLPAALMLPGAYRTGKRIVRAGRPPPAEEIERQWGRQNAERAVEQRLDQLASHGTLSEEARIIGRILAGYVTGRIPGKPPAEYAGAIADVRASVEESIRGSILEGYARSHHATSKEIGLIDGYIAGRIPGKPPAQYAAVMAECKAAVAERMAGMGQTELLLSLEQNIADVVYHKLIANVAGIVRRDGIGDDVARLARAFTDAKSRRPGAEEVDMRTMSSAYRAIELMMQRGLSEAEAIVHVAGNMRDAEARGIDPRMIAFTYTGLETSRGMAQPWRILDGQQRLECAEQVWECYTRSYDGSGPIYRSREEIMGAFPTLLVARDSRGQVIAFAGFTRTDNGMQLVKSGWRTAGGSQATLALYEEAFRLLGVYGTVSGNRAAIALMHAEVVPFENAAELLGGGTVSRYMPAITRVNGYAESPIVMAAAARTGKNPRALSFEDIAEQAALDGSIPDTPNARENCYATFGFVQGRPTLRIEVMAGNGLY